jgi:hypothetical protein
LLYDFSINLYVGDGFIHKEYLAPANLRFYRFSIEHPNGFTSIWNFDIKLITVAIGVFAKINCTEISIIWAKLFPRLHSGKVALEGQLSMPKLELQMPNPDKPASGS